MIAQIKKAAPQIGFDFGLTEKTAAPGQTVIVWLDTLYNRDVYGFSLAAMGADSVNTVSGYRYELVFSTPGSYPVTLAVTPKDKGNGNGTSLASNTIIVKIE
ncbi:hypothetical protein [uncultured Flavobacterium sp.]|uniref:hypothetical protein n=1 Tax=uncultured Flavobacterium sp. TaxID=165435 RepID=UPI0025ED238C|nr:hypothetical protein [uncultured Flavobacterium sp.]